MADPRRSPRRASRRGSLSRPQRPAESPWARRPRAWLSPLRLALRAILRGDSHAASSSSHSACCHRYGSLTDNPVLRRPVELGQFVSLAFGHACGKAGIARSMGSRGDCFDNAVAESFFATLKKELVHRRSWPTRREISSEVFEYIEAFYNRARRHSTLGML